MGITYLGLFNPQASNKSEAWTGLLCSKLVEALRRIYDDHYPLGNADNVRSILALILALLNELVDARICIHHSIVESARTKWPIGRWLTVID